MDVSFVDNANDVEMISDKYRHGIIDANATIERPEMEIPGPVRPEPDPTLIINIYEQILLQ